MAPTAHSRRRKPPESRAEAKAETRDALIDAAAALFGKEGLDAPSLDDICARAGYTRGAFYVHFRSREELIVAVVERHSRRVLDAFVDAAGGAHELEHTVRRFADAVSGGRYPHGGAVRLHHFLDACSRSRLLRERQHTQLDRVRARLAGVTRAAQSAKLLRRDVSADDAALLLTTLVLGVEQLLAVGYAFDVRAGASALLRLLKSA